MCGADHNRSVLATYSRPSYGGVWSGIPASVRRIAPSAPVKRRRRPVIPGKCERTTEIRTENVRTGFLDPRIRGDASEISPFRGRTLDRIPGSVPRIALTKVKFLARVRAISFAPFLPVINGMTFASSALSDSMRFASEQPKMRKLAAAFLRYVPRRGISIHSRLLRRTRSILRSNP